MGRQDPAWAAAPRCSMPVTADRQPEETTPRRSRRFLRRNERFKPRVSRASLDVTEVVYVIKSGESTLAHRSVRSICARLWATLDEQFFLLTSQPARQALGGSARARSRQQPAAAIRASWGGTSSSHRAASCSRGARPLG